MQEDRSLCFALIGSGRVATHLGRTLVTRGATCTGVYSPTPQHAETLAHELRAKPYASLHSICHQSGLDFILISIKDDALSEVVKELVQHSSEGVPPSPILHTAGSVPLRVITEYTPRGGVLYPMQTFSKERPLEVSQVPFFLEASDADVMALLEEICHRLRVAEVYHLSSQDRQTLHLASVFACNFVNHLYAQSAHLLQSIGLPFTIMEPLVRETLEKALSTPDPATLQTGPAVRGDQKVMTLQEEKLTALGADAARALYQALSCSIQNTSEAKS